MYIHTLLKLLDSCTVLLKLVAVCSKWQVYNGPKIKNTYLISHQLCWLSSCTNKPTVFHSDTDMWGIKKTRVFSCVGFECYTCCSEDSVTGFVMVKTHLGGIPKVFVPPPLSIKKHIDDSKRNFCLHFCLLFEVVVNFWKYIWASQFFTHCLKTAYIYIFFCSTNINPVISIAFAG